MAEIAFDNVSKRFGQITGLDALSLAIPDKSLVCLLGPSGCGKTTTLRLLAGFMRPDAGEIRVGDRLLSSSRFSAPPDRRDMAMIFQSYALWPHRTIAQNVGYGLVQRGVKRPEVAARVAEALALVQLAHAPDRYPGDLSGGQQQRVALARAIAVRPQTLLLDEPLSNLDANLREEMRAEIRRLHELYGLTTVYVTHDQAEAMTTADRIAVLSQGRIAQFGSPEDVYRRPDSAFVARFIGAANILRATPLDTDTVRVGPAAIMCGSGDTMRATVLAIRPHEVTLRAPDPTAGPAGAAANTLPARVVRQSYTGATREYLVETGTGERIKVSAPDGAARFGDGDPVLAILPAAFCRALAD